MKICFYKLNEKHKAKINNVLSKNNKPVIFIEKITYRKDEKTTIAVEYKYQKMGVVTHLPELALCHTGFKQ